MALTPKQTRAVKALLRCSTHEDAARAAGISPRTLRRWLQDEAFQDALHDAVRESLADAVLKLKSSAGTAIGALVEIAEDAESEHARVQAAGRLLDANLKLLGDAARGISSGPVPTFIYDPDERDAAPTIVLGVEPKPYIAPETYAEVERLLLGDDDDEEENEG